MVLGVVLAAGVLVVILVGEGTATWMRSGASRPRPSKADRIRYEVLLLLLVLGFAVTWSRQATIDRHAKEARDAARGALVSGNPTEASDIQSIREEVAAIEAKLGVSPAPRGSGFPAPPTSRAP